MVSHLDQQKEFARAGEDRGDAQGERDREGAQEEEGPKL